MDKLKQEKGQKLELFWFLNIFIGTNNIWDKIAQLWGCKEYGVVVRQIFGRLVVRYNRKTSQRLTTDRLWDLLATWLKLLTGFSIYWFTCCLTEATYWLHHLLVWHAVKPRFMCVAVQRWTLKAQPNSKHAFKPQTGHARVFCVHWLQKYLLLSVQCLLPLGCLCR